ncbi:membrane protein [Staphylococcus aureus]|nr:membrane protein [Staphylococcus aureus]
MTTALIGVIVLILLIISFVPNYRAMKSAKEQGSNATKLQLW